MQSLTDRDEHAIRDRGVELLADDRFAEAADLLVQALDRTPNAGLLRDLAAVVELIGNTRLSLELARAAYHQAPDQADSTVQYATKLAEAQYFRYAESLLHGLPDEDRRNPWVRAALAALYEAMGLPLLALEAYGERRDLLPWHKASRRRLWWRIGGPLVWLRRVRPVAATRTARQARERDALAEWPVDQPPARPVDLPSLLVEVSALVAEYRDTAPILDRATELEGQGRFADADDLLSSTVLAGAGLRKRAAIRSWQGRHDAALADLDAAVRRDEDDLAAVRDRIDVLVRADRYREALDLVSALPRRQRSAPIIRIAESWVYRHLGLLAMALAVLGDWDGAPRMAWLDRRSLWWRTGGPLSVVRRIWYELDRDTVETWRLLSEKRAALDQLSWPAGYQTAPIRAVLDGFWFRWAQLGARLWLLRHKIAGWVTTLGQVAIAVALSWIAYRGLGLPVLGVAIFVGSGLVVVHVLWRGIFFRFIRSATWYGMLLSAVPVGIGLLVVGYAVASGGWSGAAAWPPPLASRLPVEWPLAFVGVVMIAVAALAAWYFVCVAPLVAVWSRVFGRFLRNHPREDILDELLGLLHEMADPTSRNDLATRAGWIARLERAAVRFEKDLPRAFRFLDAGMMSWATERAAGAATAMRRLQRQVVAPVDGSFALLVRVLRRDAAAIATGDLGKLRWVAPGADPPVKRRRIRTAVTVMRVVAFATLPLLAVFAIQPLLRLETAAFGWVKVIGFGWAVLYLLLSLDPSLRDKIETAQRLSTAFGPERDEARERSTRDAVPAGGDRRR